MTYEIKHKSRNACQIAYVVEDKPRSKKPLYIIFVVLAVIAIQLGIDLRIVALGYVVVATIKIKSGTRQTVFEIELNRVTNLISVRNPSRDDSEAVTYPLNSFRGLGLYKSPRSIKTKRRPTAELFFIFDNTVSEDFHTSENAPLHEANQIIDETEAIIWHVPIQKKLHLTTLWKARKIIGSVDNWLAIPSHDQRTKASPKKTEIIRDFRDIE